MGVWDLGLLLTYVGQVTLPLETAVFIKWGGRSPVAAAMHCGSEAWPAPASRAGPLGWEGARCWLQGRLFPGRGAFRHSQQVAPLHHAATRNCQACHGCVSRQGALRECSGCVRAASEMGLATNCSHRSFENSSAQRTSILEEQSRQTLQRASSKYFPVGGHMVSVLATRLCHCGQKAATDTETESKGHSYVLVKPYLQN